MNTANFTTIEDREERQSLEVELSREVTTGHPLFDLPLTAICRRNDDDDVLFRINDGSRRVAEVHLTWRGMDEKLPWPMSRLFDSFEDWAKENSASDL
jgi:hypothetical protein